MTAKGEAKTLKADLGRLRKQQADLEQLIPTSMVMCEMDPPRDAVAHGSRSRESTVGSRPATSVAGRGRLCRQVENLPPEFANSPAHFFRSRRIVSTCCMKSRTS